MNQHAAHEPRIAIVADEVSLRRAWPVLRELRPHLDEAQFVAQAMRQMRDHDWKLAVVESDGQVRAAAGFRIMENLFSGRHLYVDDLVTLASDRSAGHGRRLLAWIEQYARDHGCGRLELDSGVQRARAHRFYFREGMYISSYHFRKDLAPPSAGKA